MAFLYVTEFPAFEQAELPYGLQPALADQKITYSTATASAAFGASTGLVRIHTDSICSIAFGGAPVATTSNARMVAGATEYFTVHPGQKVSAITNT